MNVFKSLAMFFCVAMLPFSLSIQAEEQNWTRTLEQRLLVEGPAEIEIPVEFDLSSATIRTSSISLLNSIAEALSSSQLSNVVVEVQGHTDMSGGYAINKSLSQKRAEAVKDYLNGKGVAQSRMQANGYAYDQLLQGLSMNSPKHRRVILKRIN